MHTRAARGHDIHKTRTPGFAVTVTQQRPMHLLPQNCMSRCKSCRTAMPAEVIYAVPVHYLRGCVGARPGGSWMMQ